MKLNTYKDAASFLSETQAVLELNEVTNCLILGVCQRLVEHPERATTPPSLKTVVDERGLVLAAMMTPPHNLVVYGHQGDLAAAANALVTDLLEQGWQVPGVLGPKEVAKCVVETWETATGQQSTLRRQMQLLALQEVLVPAPQHGRLRLATATDVDLVARWWAAFKTEIWGSADTDETWQAAKRQVEDGNIYLWEETAPTSIAMKTRPTRNGISVSLVYTPPEHRGQGFATACVGELSRQLLASGHQYCALFVDLANEPAKHVYRKVGYVLDSDYDEYSLNSQ